MHIVCATFCKQTRLQFSWHMWQLRPPIHHQPYIIIYDGIYYISIQFSELKVSTRANVQPFRRKSASKHSFYWIRLLVVAVYLLLMIRVNRVIWLSGHSSSQNSHFHFHFHFCLLVYAVCALCSMHTVQSDERTFLLIGCYGREHFM